MIPYVPTHKGFDLEEGFETFIAINPHRLPSYFLSQNQHRQIKQLDRRKSKAYRWFQNLQDLAYRNDTAPTTS